jgi:hypothetical protein
MLVLPDNDQIPPLGTWLRATLVGRPEEMDSGGDGVSTGSLEM